MLLVAKNSLLRLKQKYILYPFLIAFITLLLPSSIIADRGAYIEWYNTINNFDSSTWITEFSENLPRLILNSQLIFVGLIGILGTIFTAQIGLKIISFFITFYLCRFIFINSNKNYIASFLFCLSPFLVDIYLCHIRQGLAVVFLLYFRKVIFIEKLSWKTFLAGIIIIGIHSGSFILTPFIYLARISKKLKNRQFFFILLPSITSICLSSYILPLIFPYLKISYYVQRAQLNIGSGIGFIFFLAILTMFIIQPLNKLKENLFIISMILVYLIGYYTVPAIGRIPLYIMPQAYVAILNFGKASKMLTISMIGTFSFLYYLFGYAKNTIIYMN